MKPINYLNNEEKFIYKAIKEDISTCKNKTDLKLLETKLDKLLERAIIRYRQEKEIG